METIHYISDFTYFSGRKVKGKYRDVIHALREHIKYIGRKAENVFTFNLNPSEWIEKAKKEIAKRWDSRVALKFVMALPLETDKENIEVLAKGLQEFIAEQLNVEEENVSIAIHLHKGKSGNYNPHAHILVFPKTKNGKKLRLNRKDLKRFHENWQNLWREIGYKIRKDQEDLRIPHLGAKLHYDKDAQELYRQYLKVKELMKKSESVKRAIDNHEREAELRREGREFEIKDNLFEDLKDWFKQFFDKEDKSFRDKIKRNLAYHFKVLGYQPNDKLAVVLVNHRTGNVLQRIFTVEQILSDKIIKFLAGKNAEGYSVYASINVLKEDARKRRKEDFKFLQKRIYLDLDAKNEKPSELIAKLYNYLKVKQLPFPTHIVKSSKGNFQVYWLLEEPLNYDTLERIMEKMNTDLGLDHTQDVSRVFRLPYFRNKKPNKDDLVVNIKRLTFKVKDLDVEIVPTGQPVSDEAFLQLLEPVNLPEPKPLAVNDDLERFREETDKIWNEIFDRLAEQQKKEYEREKQKQIKSLMEKGYSESVAEYKVLVERNLYKRAVFLNNDDFVSLMNLAFERNKDKSPSEVDLGFAGLVFSRYKGNPPKDVLDNVKRILVFGARLRKKATPYDYADRTLEKVIAYWNKLKQDSKPKSFKFSQTLKPNPSDKPLDDKPSNGFGRGFKR